MLNSAALILLALSASQVQKLPYVDVENTEQALAMVAMDLRIVEETRLYCGAEFPLAKRLFDYHSLLWITNNEPEIAAVESYLLTIDRAKQESKMAPFVANAMTNLKSAAKRLGSDIICNGGIEQIKTGESNIANRTPKASVFLKEYLRDHPLPASEAGKRNMSQGCIAQSFNKNADLEDARATCKCITNVIYKEFTEVELAELDQVARAKGNAVSLLSFERVKPKLAACRIPVAGHN